MSNENRVNEMEAAVLQTIINRATVLRPRRRWHLDSETQRLRQAYRSFHVGDGVVFSVKKDGARALRRGVILHKQRLAFVVSVLEGSATKKYRVSPLKCKTLTPVHSTI